MITKLLRSARAMAEGLFTRPSVAARLTISQLPLPPGGLLCEEEPSEGAWLVLLLLPDTPGERK